LVTCRILPGLPAVGSAAVQFSEPGERTHAEGLVVEITPAHGSAWVGNFRPGLSDNNAVFAHPNGADAVVVAGGRGYVVNADSRLVSKMYRSVRQVVESREADRLVLASDVSVAILGPADVHYETRRLAWDGLQSLRADGRTLYGEAWDSIADAWRPFEVNLDSGEVTGGCVIAEEPVVARTRRPWWKFWQR
jgi:hypothetical protein